MAPSVWDGAAVATPAARPTTAPKTAAPPSIVVNVMRVFMGFLLSMSRAECPGDCKIQIRRMTPCRHREKLPILRYCDIAILRLQPGDSVQEAVQQGRRPRNMRQHGSGGALTVSGKDRHHDRLVLLVGMGDIA